ncbi:MAG: amidase family protein [Thermomicrobiales bacterium]
MALKGVYLALLRNGVWCYAGNQDTIPPNAELPLPDRATQENLMTKDHSHSPADHSIQEITEPTTLHGKWNVNRRQLVIGSAAIAAASLAAGVGISTRGTASASLLAQGDESVGLVEVTVAQLRDALDRGDLTVRQLVQACLDRIAANDQKGPTLRAVIETNPDALTIADELDAELKAGKSRGPLHGIPVLLKDNIATADKMETTAGSFALKGAIPTRDSFIVGQLRTFGLVILGKANLSEWANIRSSQASSGWTGRGGQSVNPYQLDRTPSGSSSGSAIALSASYVPLAIGSETDGSLVSPAGHCGIVSIKPTLGLVSRMGVIPISHNQDTAGPMARNVADAAALLNVLAVVDHDDPANQMTIQGGVGMPQTIASPAASPQASPAVGAKVIGIPTYPTRPESATHPIDYTDPAILGADGLRGARIGVLRAAAGFSVGADQIFGQALTAIKELGAEVIDPVEMPSLDELKTSPDELDVLLWDFKADLPAYIEGYVDPSFPVRNLKDVIAFNEAHFDEELQWFGQDLFITAEKKSDLQDPEYIAAVLRNQQRGREDGIDAVLKKYQLDAIVAPTNAPATKIDLVNGDHWMGGTSTAAAVAGYPLVTVPAGYIAGLPVGITFMGGAFSEETLIRCAYAFEQHTLVRTAPTYATPAVLPPGGPSGDNPAATPEVPSVATPVG